MVDHVVLRRESVLQILSVVRGLGVGQSLDVILDRVARSVVDSLGFGAVVINVRTLDGNLVVKTAVGPDEVCDMVGESMSHDTWMTVLSKSEKWGELYFLDDLDAIDAGGDLAYRDPDRSYYHEFFDDPTEKRWRPNFLLLAPMWSDRDELLGVLSVDLPVSGMVPEAEQCAMLELFASQAGAAIAESARVDSVQGQQLLYRVAFLESPIATAMLDLDATVVEANAAFATLVGQPSTGLQGLTLSSIFEGGEPYDTAVDRRVLTARPAERWARVRVRDLVTAAGTRYVCTAEDRSETRRALEILRARADHDDLTSLAVRSVAMTELAARLTRPSVGSVHVFLYCDLDGFKAVNDGYGHPIGDRVLVEIARRLRECVGPDDVVCRLGGDEFGVVATRSAVTDAESLIASCLGVGTDDVRVDTAGATAVATVGLSIGACILPDVLSESHTTASVVEAADAMLYQVKNRGGHGWDAVVLASDGTS